MPLITPSELITYTSFTAVKERDPALLQEDILEAEMEIYGIVNHQFTDTTKYSPMPPEVKLACKKLAQYYALLNADESEMKRMKSEKIGDYTYQRDGLQKPDISSLLQAHIQVTAKNGLRMRVRTL